MTFVGNKMLQPVDYRLEHRVSLMHYKCSAALGFFFVPSESMERSLPEKQKLLKRKNNLLVSYFSSLSHHVSLAWTYVVK